LLLPGRANKIFSMLLESSKPLRIKDIAREFQVSERTVKYDLDLLRDWLKKYDINLYSKPNVGIWIDERDKNTRVSNELKRDLSLNEGLYGFFERPERIRRLTLELLVNDSFYKISDLAEKFEVSRNTIVRDLNIIEKDLKQRHLVIERTRQGIRIRGSEFYRRLALEYLVQSTMEEKEMNKIIMNVIKERVGKEEKFLLIQSVSFLSKQELEYVFSKIRLIISRIENELEIMLSDRIIINIFIRLIITIQRLKRKKNENLDFMTTINIQQLKMQKLYQIFKEVLNGTPFLNFIFTESELIYISLPTIEIVQPLLDDIKNSEYREIDVYEKTIELIKRMTIKTKINFEKDDQLLNALLVHLKDKVVKFRFGIIDPNPILGAVISSFSTMFHLIKECVYEVFKEEDIYFTDADLAYIVLHFQAAYERQKKNYLFKALIVCNTGRGTAQLLKTMLENEIPELKIIGTSSIFTLKRQIELKKPDLIISVVPIEDITIPFIKVHNIPTEDDILRIHKITNKLQKNSSTELFCSSVEGENYFEPVIAEQFVQNIIFKGYVLSQKIIQEFKDNLTEERAEGLKLHILLLAGRIAFNSFYDFEYTDYNYKFNYSSEMRERLEKILKENEINIPESEIIAILQYFK